jgi:hypothetical protein
MAKCAQCGFLAVWDLRNTQFQEASEWFRAHGVPEHVQENRAAYQAKCFVQADDLIKEVPQSPGRGTEYTQAILSAIKRDRNCSVATPWKQGFHPKEHQEMIDRRSERRWRVIEGLIFAVAGGLVAVLSQIVTKPPIVNITPPTVNVTTPPVNVMVQPTEVQPAAPKTKHDPQPQQP